MTTLFGNLVDLSIERLRMFEPPEGYWLAFSGGKDSCVLLDLAERAGVKFEAHYSVISFDPPELLRFIKREFADKGRVKMDIPPKPFFLLMRYNGYPTRTVRWCCREMKERGGNGRFVLTGIRWAESTRRRKRKMNDVCARRSARFLHPIIDWSDADVWAYIRERNLPMCGLYAEGYKRIGCVGCPMNTDTTWLARWPGIARSWRQAFKDLFENPPADAKRLSRQTAWRQNWSSWDALFDAWCDRSSNLHGDLADDAECGLFPYSEGSA